MDSLTHSLAAAALAKTPLGRSCRVAPAVLLIGANLPDVDVIAWWLGVDGWVGGHRGLTHSLAGVVLLALALFLAAIACERAAAALRPSRGADATASGAGSLRDRWPTLLVAAFVAVASHPLLDALNDRGVAPWLPWSAARVSADLLHLTDPWAWLAFGGAAALAGPRTRAGSIAWTATAIGAFAWLSTVRRAPLATRLAFAAAVLLIALARRRGIGAQRPRRVLLAGLLALAAYLAALERAAATAVARALARPPGPDSVWRADPPAPERFVMRAAVLGDPFHWRVGIESGGQLEWRRVDLDGRAAPREARDR